MLENIAFIVIILSGITTLIGCGELKYDNEQVMFLHTSVKVLSISMMLYIVFKLLGV